MYHEMVEIPPEKVTFHGFVFSKPLADPKVISREASNVKDLTIVLETIDSNSCREHVTLASRHCYSAVWRQKWKRGGYLVHHNPES